MDATSSFIAIFAAYLIGSLSFAVIVSKVMRLPDPRSYGSHNPGATNVLRSGSKVAAVLTLLLDGIKGYIPTALVAYYAFELGLETPSMIDTVVGFVGLAAFFGHLFPVFFRFQGGKGVATAAGVLFAYEPMLGAMVLGMWILIAAIFRYSSLAAIVAALMAPFFAMMVFNRPMISLAVVCMSVLLIWRHWGNIVKLMAGRESRIGEKPDPAASNKRRRRHSARRVPH
jgi:glycerol-3-phosphate acyltransferase PlsY